MEDIGRDELRKFTDWAFWEGRAGEAGEQGDDGDDGEIEEYIQKIEMMVPKGFVEGPGKARSLRLTMDPIEIESRLVYFDCVLDGDQADTRVGRCFGTRLSCSPIPLPSHCSC